MVVRQVIVGVSGGAVLAVVALLLTASPTTNWSTGPEWVQAAARRMLAGVSPGTVWSSQGVETTERAQREHLLLGEDAAQRSDGVGVTALGPSEEKLDVSLLRVAALGASVGALPPSAQTEILASEGRSPAQAGELDAELYLGALSKQTVIRSEPKLEAPIIGFARTGALLRRSSVLVSTKGCKGGWYRVEPDGYVCVGKAATLDADHPILRLSSYQPDRSLAMPYPYGRSRYPTPPLYTRIPTQDQQRLAEQDLTGHLRKNFGALWAAQADTSEPSLLSGGKLIPRPYGYPMLEHDFMTGRALANSAFAFIDLFEADGRRWGLTADLALLPLDRVVPVEESDFFGLVLSHERTLPVAFMRTRGEYYYERNDKGALVPIRKVAYREAFHLTGNKVEIFGATFVETTSGGFVRNHERLVTISPRSAMPKWATGRRSWLEISILDQTLVAYVGDRPVFATLVSTGKDGLGDPEETKSTVLGSFLIHTKHVTSTMSGDEADDEFDLRDVPYVQYFHGGYALHAAFWHDDFGRPRSHGCVNLSPADARHLFSITEPAVPLRWHSALSREGSLVYIRP